MANDIDELVFKVNVEVADEELKQLRTKLQNMQKDASQNAIKLGIKTPDSDNKNQSSTGTVSGQNSTRSGSNASNNTAINPQSIMFSQDVLNVMIQSEQHLLEILNTLKSNHNSPGSGIANYSGTSANMKGPFPFVQDLINTSLIQKIGGIIGGTIGGTVGLLGGPVGVGAGAMGGAQIGTAVAGLGEQAKNEVQKKLEFFAGLFDEKMSEDLHLRQLSTQTGLLAKDLYQLGAQAKLAGTSLEAVVDSNQQLADELLGGMSDKKAQSLMALNINPMDLLQKSGGDFGKLNQLIFEAFEKATKDWPAAMRAAFARNLGISAEMQDARKYLNDPSVKKEARNITNLATSDGKTPFLTAQQVNAQQVQMKGMELEVEARVRSLLQQDGLVQKIALTSMEVHATTINILSGVIQTAVSAATPIKKAEIEKPSFPKFTRTGEFSSFFTSPVSDKAGAPR